MSSGSSQAQPGVTRSPVWSPDGRELFYQTLNDTLSVSIETAPELAVGSPELPFTQADPLTS